MYGCLINGIEVIKELLLDIFWHIVIKKYYN